MGDKVVEIASQIGCTPSQVAINWVQQQVRAQIIPILGVRTLDQLDDNLGVLKFELSDDQIREIDELSDFQVGFPRSFLHDDYVLELIHGKTYQNLEIHR